MDDDKNTPTGDDAKNQNNGGNDGGKNNDEPKNNDDKSGNDGESNTFTQEDLDRIAAKTREEEKKKAQKMVDQAVQKATEEAERRAKLSEEERAKELEEKRKQEFAEREKNVTLRENRAGAIEKFSELNLPVKMVDFVVDLDPESQETRIADFKEAYDAAVKEGVAEALKGKAPKDMNSNSSNNSGVEQAPTQF